MLLKPGAFVLVDNIIVYLEKKMLQRESGEKLASLIAQKGLVIW